MDEQELKDIIDELKQDRDKQRDDFDKLRHEYDVLAGKLRYPGTEFLVNLEYQRIFNKTVTAISSTYVTTEVFDTIQGVVHSGYVLSALCANSSVPVVVTDGAIIVAPSDTITVALQRQVQTGPTRVEVRAVIYNSSITDFDVSIYVWKRLGLK